MKRRSGIVGDAILGLLFSGLIVMALLVVGNIQANQYRSTVRRIDQNTQAIVCILQIDPIKRSSSNVAACLSRYGLPTSSAKGAKP